MYLLISFFKKFNIFNHQHNTSHYLMIRLMKCNIYKNFIQRVQDFILK